MHLTRRNTRLRSFRNVLSAIFAIFLLTNVVDSSFTRVFAPVSAAAKRFNCSDLSDAESNVEAGTKYLRWLLKHFDGDVALALAAYNAGEGSVEKHAGVPPFAETQNYVRVITGRYGKTYHPVLAPEDAAAYFNLLPGVPQEIASR